MLQPTSRRPHGHDRNAWVREIMNGNAQRGGSAGGGTGRGGPEGEGEGLESRRRRLEAALATRKPKSGRAEGMASEGSAYAQALTLSSEFIGAVAVGFGLGYGLDYLFGTKPWGMIVFLLLGFCAGVLNVMRTAGMISQPRIWGKSDAGNDGKGRPDGG